ncbi:MAG: 6-carboxytetrahydropterin synthase [Phycisphaerales bacterium]|nr:6-carboxytetrahydropterin synthase [Phycisphaerales bacterium]
MIYRVCKSFEIENGHMLSKHPGRCRFPHGHSRRVDLVISADRLDENDMVCDFKALKLAVKDYLDQHDHALMVNSDDAILDSLEEQYRDRLIVLEGTDPTTEVLAERIYGYVERQIRAGGVFTDPKTGNSFSLPTHLTLERVRVTETSSSWAEYGIA